MIQFVELIPMFNRYTMNNNLPRHVAIIPDGNRRWADKTGLPRRRRSTNLLNMGYTFIGYA
jgi:undecaprenyl pyrophosphate synthase